MSNEQNELKQAAQLALEALSLALSDVDWRVDSPTQPQLHKAYNNLHEALALRPAAQPSEQWETSPLGGEQWETSPKGGEQWQTVPFAQPVGEPVAEVYSISMGRAEDAYACIRILNSAGANSIWDLPIRQGGNLYTTPQPSPERVPMTDEQIHEAVRKAVRDRKLSWLGFKKDADGVYTIPVLSPCDYQFVRAIEAHHGITTPKTAST